MTRKPLILVSIVAIIAALVTFHALTRTVDNDDLVYNPEEVTYLSCGLEEAESVLVVIVAVPDYKAKLVGMYPFRRVFRWGLSGYLDVEECCKRSARPLSSESHSPDEHPCQIAVHLDSVKDAPLMRVEVALSWLAPNGQRKSLDKALDCKVIEHGAAPRWQSPDGVSVSLLFESPRQIHRLSEELSRKLSNKLSNNGVEPSSGVPDVVESGKGKE